MTAYQNDFFGGVHRADPLVSIFMGKLREYGQTPSLPITDIYKIMAAEFIADSPQIAKAVRAILQSGNEETGLKIIEAVFRHRDMPAADSVPRAMREARKNLEEIGGLILPEEEDKTSKLPDFDTLLVDIEASQPNIDSGLEARFHIQLLERFNGLTNWMRPGHVEQYSVDFLSTTGGVAIEIDSWEFHRDQVSFTKDRRKSRMVQRAGYTHLQYSGGELTVKGGIGRALDEINDALQWKLKHPTPKLV